MTQLSTVLRRWSTGIDHVSKAAGGWARCSVTLLYYLILISQACLICNSLIFLY